MSHQAPLRSLIEESKKLQISNKEERIEKKGRWTEGLTPTQAQRKEVEEARLKDMKIKNYLFQSIDRTIMETILDKNTAKSIWDSMRQKYQGSTRVKRAQLQALRKEFEILQMKEGKKVDEYFARALTIANKMKAHEERMG
ncbi:hypothetical protein CK203_030868 [Vitis vinifera]|uniref:Retrovirus-related Pol polyprotein from transposon TNT 1-94 n=1 Tax=Vitis vinifera TaxID=29760 RepID=A0A438ID86_VITVI|nr:hypothetical protein CK203_030868 [Vitis vinifera]